MLYFFILNYQYIKIKNPLKIAAFHMSLIENYDHYGEIFMFDIKRILFGRILNKMIIHRWLIVNQFWAIKMHYDNGL